MFDILFDEESEKDKKEKAANNLIVLSREDAGAERIFQNNGVTLLLNMIETGKPEMILAAVLKLSEIALAACNLFQCINDSLTGGDTREYGKEADLVMDPSKDLKTILLSLLEMVASKKVSGHGRDQALNLLSKNVPRKEKKEMDHSKSLFTIDHGLKKILKVCGQRIHTDYHSCINCISGLLQGPFDVVCFSWSARHHGDDGALCGSEREVDQMVAVEALIHASSKMSRASFIITNGLLSLCILIVCPLQGLCKLGSAGGDDYSLSNLLRLHREAGKWAIEGLAYLTNDADVKDDFVDDEPAMQAMFELAKTILYAVACILVNCTNSYEKKEILPELVQLAKFSKQHALVVMVKAENIILTDQTKEDAGKALIPLALEGTEAGKVKASHVIAKIAAISNPEIAFPGERVYEVIRPLVNLLHTDREGMQNYEALRGLTNLAGFSEKLRVKIVKEKALPEIENTCEDSYGNDKLKLLVLLCGEDDDKLQIAAAGALAMITAAQKKLCTKMTLVTSQWLEILQRLCLHSNVQVQHRGLVIVYNMLNSDNSDLAKKLIESELLEILSVVGRAEDNPKRQEAIDAARTCLVKAMDLGLIKPFASPS
uniref:Unc-45 myosin chaperone B n=1 Tax=Maylandia zebra TaxID=106582 RepID=A0A3P9DH53_9CICH